VLSIINGIAPNDESLSKEIASVAILHIIDIDYFVC